MNTNELRCILTRDEKIRTQLIDVFALDEFKKFVKKNRLINGIYVCNDQIAEKSGNHWFLIYVTDANVNFIDSFAKDPKFYKIHRELNTRKKLNKLDYPLQSLLSDVCGEFMSWEKCTKSFKAVFFKM